MGRDVYPTVGVATTKEIEMPKSKPLTEPDLITRAITKYLADDGKGRPNPENCSVSRDEDDGTARIILRWTADRKKRLATYEWDGHTLTEVP
jgi:hypothetical protein